MRIDKSLAQAIVSEMRKIIKQDINFISTDGIIIASTDENREDRYHEGATVVNKTFDDLIIKNDYEYEGTKKGINLPIFFQNDIVGVLGVTGKTNEIQKFAEIIKRMTELLIKDAYMYNLQLKRREHERMIIEEIIAHKEFSEREFNEKIEFFDLDFYANRKVMIFKVVSPVMKNYKVLEDINNVIEAKFYNSKYNLLMNSNNSTILILDTDQNNEDVIKDIANLLKSNYNYKIKIAIGTPATNINDIRESYENAMIVLQWIVNSENEYIKSYNEMDIELLLDKVDNDTLILYKEKLTKNMNQKEFQELLQIISLFGKYNGSIQIISEKMFIHKNTLQYKLNKIRDKTGLDMRNYIDFSCFYQLFLLERQSNIVM